MYVFKLSFHFLFLRVLVLLHNDLGEPKVAYFMSLNAFFSNGYLSGESRNSF